MHCSVEIVNVPVLPVPDCAYEKVVLSLEYNSMDCGKHDVSIKCANSYLCNCVLRLDDGQDALLLDW